MTEKKNLPTGSSTLRVPGRARKSSATPGSRLVQNDSDAPQKMRAQSVSLRTARGRTTAQQRWLSRQLNDPYVQAAHKQGWRSRAAFKLIELDDRFHLIRPGMRIVDLGAAPGGWTQVLVKRGAAQVVGVDLLPVEPVTGAEIIEGDFTDPEMDARLISMLGGKADLVVSDMAPNTTGHAPTDHVRIIGLAEEALHFAFDILAEGGGFVAKVFQGGSEKAMLNTMKQAFTQVRHAKPPASRKDSSELYVVATGFRPDRINAQTA
ncbi:RlmE family RNA methyltransferase [Acetobacter oryzifermentans]|uniref:RlmE family RNA methyltransferase n=1 Tax=Acetobacter oryzifermentans TaxID=1633874 RepID=UPI0039BEFF4B